MRPTFSLRYRLLPFLLMLSVAVLLSSCKIGGGGGGSDGQARFRVLNASTGYTSLDVYSNDDNDDKDDDAQRFSGVSYGAISDYVSVKAATYTLGFRRAGASTSLLSLTAQSMAEDTNATYVGYGSTGHFQVYKISDDQKDADSGKAAITIVNVAEAGALDVYFTEESLPLTDTSPQISGVTSGSSLGATISSATYRMRVTGAGDNTDIRLDVSGLTFSSTQVATIVLTPTSGGMLVNALLIPQQGSVTSYKNPNARIRGAVGISNGTKATLAVNGTTLLSNATVGIISSTYQQVKAGSLPVTVVVDGTAATIPNQTVTAGADYTLLVWSDAGGTQATLISDDNRAPEVSGNVKIRLMNGMSALAGPISFTVNFSPTADDVAVGEASSYTEIAAGSDFEIDVKDALTSSALFSKTGVSLTGGAVYTMFMYNGATPSATLRRDR
jgi:Domain of unknown function (DUF4397)